MLLANPPTGGMRRVGEDATSDVSKGQTNGEVLVLMSEITAEEPYLSEPPVTKSIVDPPQL